MNVDLKAALEERDAALASLDPSRIAAYLRKWGEPEAAAMLERGGNRLGRHPQGKAVPEPAGGGQDAQ